MSADTFTSAMFLITAILAAGVLINATFPVVYNMAGTFSSASHESDERIRTDFKIITTFATTTQSPRYAMVWIKNIGSSRVPWTDLKRSDVFCGSLDNFEHLSYSDSPTTSGQWGIDFTYPSYDLNNNGYWDPGETAEIYAITNTIPTSSGEYVYFQFSIPNGVWRSTEFAAR